MKRNNKIKHVVTKKQAIKLKRKKIANKIKFKLNMYNYIIIPEKEKLSEILTWNLDLNNNMFGKKANSKHVLKIYNKLKRWK